MNYFDKNISLMQSIFPHLVQKILYDKTALFTEKKLEVKNTPCGAVTILVNGIYVHSGRDPIRESEKLLQSIFAEETHKGCGSIIFLGLGLGYAALEAAKIYKGNTFIIVEKEIAILKAALQHNDFSYLLMSRQIIFVCGGTATGIISALNDVKNITAIIKNIPLINLDKDWYDDILKNINLINDKAKVNTASLKRFGRRWQKNISANLYALRDIAGVNLLFGKFNFPVLLIAAGPSLDDIAPFIKEIADRFVITAADTALRFLHEKNVIPDFVFTVDPQFWNSRHLSRVMPKKAILIAESSVYPSAMRGASFVFSTVFPLWRFCENNIDCKGDLAAGGSVVTSAWDFVRLLNDSDGGQKKQKIFIAALDLSFPDLKTHYKGALFEEISVFSSYRFATAETKSFLALRGASPYYTTANRSTKKTNNMVLTDKRLSLYASWFENKFLQHANIENYSLTSGALLIKGLKNISIEDVLAMPVVRDSIEKTKQKVFAEINERWNSETNKQVRLKKYNACIENIKTVLEKTKTEIEDAAKRQNFKIEVKNNSLLQSIFFADEQLKDLEFITRENSALVISLIDFFLYDIQK